MIDLLDRPRWHPIWAHNPIIAQPVGGMFTEPVHRLRDAPGCRPYIVYPFTEDTGWTFDRSFRARDHVARVYLQPDELELGQAIRRAHGPFVLIDSWSKHPNLRWPVDHWQTLVAARPDLTFIQHTYHGVPATAVIRAPNVHDYVTGTFRVALGVVAAAQVYVRGESGMLHGAAAIGARTVAIWGGCMDWDVLGGYAGQTRVGPQTPACGTYRLCAHCAQIMRAITPTQVAAALDQTISVK